MLPKEIKIPITVGVIIYGIALFIDLFGVLFQKSVFTIMNAPYELLSLDENIFPLTSVYQMIVMIMYIIFMLIMFRYKGSAKRVAGIVMIAVYCVVSVSYPVFNMIDNRITALLKGAGELAALGTLNSYITAFTLPFTVVSSVFVLIAIGRYGVMNSYENNTENGIKYTETIEYTEGQQND